MPEYGPGPPKLQSQTLTPQRAVKAVKGKLHSPRRSQLFAIGLHKLPLMLMLSDGYPGYFPFER
jgi:hypothetical protein